MNKTNLTLFAAVFAAGAAFAAPAEKVKLTAGKITATSQIKWYVAKDVGFFDDEGLDVTLLEFTNSADGLAALRAGKIDVGPFGSTAPLIHIAKGADIRIIGGTMGGGVSYVVKKDSPISKIEDFRGKKIATVRLSTGDAVLRGALKRAGIDWRKDVDLIELKSPVAVAEAVKTDKVDIGSIWEPHDQRVEEWGLKIIAQGKDWQPGHPCCRVISTVDLIARKEAERPDVWVAFLRAFLKAQRFVENPANHEKVLDILVTHNKLDRKLLENSFFSDNLDIKSDPNIKGVQFVWDTLIDDGFVEPGPSTPKDIKSTIITKYYLAALDSLIKEEPEDKFWQELKAEYPARNE
jgi:NitT/TauT family transport system substrate-binding protein